MDEKDIINMIPLTESTNQLAQQILDENDTKKVQDLTHLFNLNQAKKNVIRVIKLNELLDKVSDQMIERFTKRADEISHSDLLSYMQVVQSSIDRANKSLNLVDETPAIQVNQVNINMPEPELLDRDSRAKVTEAIKAILQRVETMKDSDGKDIIEITDTSNEIVSEDYEVKLKGEDENG